MDFVKIRRPFSTDAEGNIESCTICSEYALTNGDIERLKSTVNVCEADAEEDETFEELIERVVDTFNKAYHRNLCIVYPSYEVDI